jgi:hypothetical protein
MQHLGPFMGRRNLENEWPKIVRWLNETRPAQFRRRARRDTANIDSCLKTVSVRYIAKHLVTCLRCAHLRQCRGDTGFTLRPRRHPERRRLLPVVEQYLRVIFYRIYRGHKFVRPYVASCQSCKRC